MNPYLITHNNFNYVFRKNTSKRTFHPVILKNQNKQSANPGLFTIANPFLLLLMQFLKLEANKNNTEYHLYQNLYSTANPSEFILIEEVDLNLQKNIEDTLTFQDEFLQEFLDLVFLDKVRDRRSLWVISIIAFHLFARDDFPEAIDSVYLSEQIHSFISKDLEGYLKGFHLKQEIASITEELIHSFKIPKLISLLC